jgi:succinate dehydrogenase/fumarate reductase flavoprotein subunit
MEFLSSNTTIDCDVVVVGGGNAGFCAAISAAQSGAGKVILIDKCPEEWAGGNSYFTAGAFRTVHHGLEDILSIANNVDSATAKIIDLAPYTRDDFLGDLSRVTHRRSDPELGRALIDESNESVKWLARNGVRFQLSFNRQAYKIDGRFKFWGGMCLKTEDGGKGLIVDHQRAAKRLGVTVLYSTAAKNILLDPKSGAFRSLLVTDKDGNSLLINAKAVILAGKCYPSRTGCCFPRILCFPLAVFLLLFWCFVTDKLFSWWI